MSDSKTQEKYIEKLLKLSIGKPKYLNLDAIREDLRKFLKNVCKEFEEKIKKDKDYFSDEDGNLNEDLVYDVSCEFEEELYDILYIVKDEYRDTRLTRHGDTDAKIQEVLTECMGNYMKTKYQ